MIINAGLVGGGLLIGVIASVVVYRLIQGHLRRLKGIPPEVDELAAEALESTEETSLLLNFSSDSINEPSEERRQNLIDA
jgi:hypothetical protein